MRFRRKNLKAYSLIEIIASLGVMGVVMTMLFSVLILSLQITFKILARSFVREELSNITAQISRDIRNADDLPSCGFNGSSASECELIINGDRYKWMLCDDKICKDQIKTDGTQVTIYRSSGNVSISGLISAIGGYKEYSISGSTEYLLCTTL